MKNNILMLSILALLISSPFAPISLGSNTNNSKEQLTVEDFNFDSYHVNEITSYAPYNSLEEITNNDIIESSQIDIQKETLEPLDGPMDSPWPMYCHDVRHTGRSPYSTADNLGAEKWKFWTELSGIPSGIAISDDGTIYFSGSYDLYAVYPNGTLKWRYDDTGGVITSTPAIDENGVVYVGTAHAVYGNYLYAIYPNGTLKWKYKTGNHIHGSPAIGEDGTIYFGKDESGSPPYSGYIIALYPDGTEKWRYKTNHFIYSSPAIGNDGTVYCGSHDGNLYALYPNNGTLKWKYHTGDWVGRGPSIADDGTIYFGSWDGYLYTVYPNGTLKWKTGGYLAGTTPIIGADGTIYVGNRYLTAIYPNNGSVKWSFDPGPESSIRGSNPCISADGTIYFGTYDGGKIHAVNSDGTEKWRKSIGGDVQSAPAIGEDGTVYIGSQLLNGGYLHAFGPLDPDAPSAPTITGPGSGKVGTSYTYTFTSIDPDGDQVSYYIEWGNGDITDWTDFQPSGDSYSESHTWATKGTYVIRAKAKDTEGYESDWGTLTVSMPRDKAISNMLLLRFLERFPYCKNCYFL